MVDAVALLGSELVALRLVAALVCDSETVVAPVSTAEASLLCALVTPLCLAAAVCEHGFDASVVCVLLAKTHVFLGVLVTMLLFAVFVAPIRL